MTNNNKNETCHQQRCPNQSLPWTRSDGQHACTQHWNNLHIPPTSPDYRTNRNMED